MKNWSLNKKIWSIVGLLSLSFMISTSVAVYSLMSVRDGLEFITGTAFKRADLAAQIRDNQRVIALRAVDTIVISDPEKMKKSAAALSAAMVQQSADFSAYNEIASEKGKELLAKYKTSYEVWSAEMVKASVFGVANKKQEAEKTYLNALEVYVVPMRADLDALTSFIKSTVADRSSAEISTAQRAIWTSIVVSLVSIFSCLLIAFFVLRALGQSIRSIVANLSENASQVGSASTQIASASEELSQATTEQAASLEETAASVEEMNSMVAKNSENAGSAALQSSTSQKKANDGKTMVEKMAQSMEAINQSNTAIMAQVNLSNESMSGIIKVIEQIDKKTKVINEIVNKTELLSFNASVEAARAGEHGKGFAVVAEEVGNLARMSGAAAEEIGSLLEKSISDVNHIVSDTKTKVEKLISEGRLTVESGAQVVRQCAEVFDEVVQNVTSVSGMATEIASASQEQSRGCAEITKAMSQLDQMTQQNAATSEECASAAEELSAQAESLKSAVTQLVLTVNGNNETAHVLVAGQESVPPLRKSVKPKSSPGAVVRLKSPKKQLHGDGAEPQFKKAAGDAPAYDSSGFNDV